MKSERSTSFSPNGLVLLLVKESFLCQMCSVNKEKQLTAASKKLMCAWLPHMYVYSIKFSIQKIFYIEDLVHINFFFGYGSTFCKFYKAFIVCYT